VSLRDEQISITSPKIHGFHNAAVCAQSSFVEPKAYIIPQCSIRVPFFNNNHLIVRNLWYQYHDSTSGKYLQNIYFSETAETQTYNYNERLIFPCLWRSVPFPARIQLIGGLIQNWYPDTFREPHTSHSPLILLMKSAGTASVFRVFSTFPTRRLRAYNTH
jgi:hypothetical protein